MHLHSELGIEYEPLDIEERGADPTDPEKVVVGVHVAFEAPGACGLHLLTLIRSVTPLQLAELREGLRE